MALAGPTTCLNCPPGESFKPWSPDRLAAICSACDEHKTPRDLKEIARAKRLAEKHQAFLAGQKDKVTGRRAPSRRQWDKLSRSIGQPIGADRGESGADADASELEDGENGPRSPTR